MSMLENNVLNKNQIKFNKNPRFYEKEFRSIDFEKAIFSINEKSEKFSNFIKDTGDPKFKELKKLYLSDRPFDILNCEFETKNVFKNNKENIEKVRRLFKIINITGSIFLNCNFIDYTKIIRYKSWEHPEYQLYFYNKNSILKLILVDMHHLGITAIDRKTMKNDYKDKYNEVYSRYKTDISLIKEDIMQ